MPGLFCLLPDDNQGTFSHLRSVLPTRTYRPTTNDNHGVQDTDVRNKTLSGLSISKTESAKEPLWPMPHVKDRKSVHLDVAVIRSQLFSFTGINRHHFIVFGRFYRRRGDMTPCFKSIANTRQPFNHHRFPRTHF